MLWFLEVFASSQNEPVIPLAGTVEPEVSRNILDVHVEKLERSGEEARVV